MKYQTKRYVKNELYYFINGIRHTLLWGGNSNPYPEFGKVEAIIAYILIITWCFIQVAIALGWADKVPSALASAITLILGYLFGKNRKE